MMRTVTAEVDVLRNGAHFCTLTYDLADPPSINANAAAELPISAAGTFAYEPDVDWLSDEISIAMYINGIRYPVGIFRIAHKTDRYTDSGAHWVQLEMYDRCLLLKQQKLENPLHIAAGTNYVSAVLQVLTLGGISLYLASATAAVLPADREWEIGTSLLAIINELLIEINYNAIWFNSSGVAMLQPYATPRGDLVQHTYAAGEMSVLHGEAETELDLYDAPNVFICICENPDLPAPLTSTAVNDNPRSAASTLRRGIRIPTVIKVDSIADQTELDAYATRLAQAAILASETVEISTGVMPDHGVRDIIGLQHPEIQGVFEETAWSMTIGPGQEMRHTLRRVVFS